LKTTISSVRLELEQKDLVTVQVQYCDVNGNVIEKPSIFELACYYASKYNIQFDHIKVDSVIDGTGR
jgi:hypothetical protein